MYRAILLGSRGFDVPKVSQKLESLNTAKSLEAIEPVWETDIEVCGVWIHRWLYVHVCGTVHHTAGFPE